MNRSIATYEHVPPSPYPASSPVIPPPTAADLPNRQAPCLRNSSAHAGPGSWPGPRVGDHDHVEMDGVPLGPRLELGRDQLRDLGGVQRRALAQVVAADEELDRARVIERLADPPDPGRVGADHVHRRGE